MVMGRRKHRHNHLTIYTIMSFLQFLSKAMSTADGLEMLEYVLDLNEPTYNQ